MKLVSKTLIIATLLSIVCSTNYAQNSRGKIELFITLEGDTLFLHDKAHAEFNARRYDSLATLQWLYPECKEGLRLAEKNVNEKISIIKGKDETIRFWEDQYESMTNEAQSYERELEAVISAQENLQEALKKSNRKLRRSKALKWTFAGVAIAITPPLLYLAFKK